MNKVSQMISYQIILFCKIVKEILDFAIYFHIDITIFHKFHKRSVIELYYDYSFVIVKL